MLTKARLFDVARELELSVASSLSKDALAEAITSSHRLRFRDLLQRLGRDELRAACRAHGLLDVSRSRPELMSQLLQAHGVTDSIPPQPLFSSREARRDVPVKNDIVRCRHRQWLVEDVVPSAEPQQATLVRLVCLDDDHQGRALDVLWELELGASILQPAAHGLSAGTDGITRIDPPAHFAAYLHALQWSSVTAADPKLLQAPFRAGIALKDYQLTPLRKALLLPRANLFIADDVGLGKTIEAGLVLQELLLRQRVEVVVIVCPPSVALQWRDEMNVRFGLSFEIYNRAFVGRRRQERGFGVNPWSTHSRFIVSYQTLRRPEHRDPLLAHLSAFSASPGGERARKSMLILDEAHTAAPAGTNKFMALDSRITGVIRDITPRFENRLFLSATPHNGHSNSFSALLEMLDPNRFTRGVEVSPVARDAVMVRRLKEDLRTAREAEFPRRDVIRIDLTHEGASWSAKRSVRQPNGTITPHGMARPLEDHEPVELRLATLLAQYTALMKPEKGTGRLVFVNLQKRLLSSIAAFHRTLQLHAERVLSGTARVQLSLTSGPGQALSPVAQGEGTRDEPDEIYGESDEALDAADDVETLTASAKIATPAGQARALLDEMSELARIHHAGPDAKALALLDWIREHQCAGARVGGLAPRSPKSDKAWTDTRVLVFTEYGDTKKWLKTLLGQAIEGSDRHDERIRELHGGMADDERAAVQAAFNGPPSEHPVRILLATDAAREGVNLQGFCADLFHFDIPWNPARLEQRNGRIDRTLQQSPVVRCHYFVYPGRGEDLVLDTVVTKVEVIRRELGSLGSVVMERFDRVLERGIDARTKLELDEAENAGGMKQVAGTELESVREDQEKLKKELDDCQRALDVSKRVMEFDPPLLREAIDVGFALAGTAPGLARATDAANEDAWTLPPLPPSWDHTLDSLRPPRAADEPIYEWRKRPLPAVTFTPPKKISDQRVHLHLSHPLVQRVLSRFRAQGFSAHDLSRVTVVRSRNDHVARVIAFGRLSLFGRGASRLHDQLIPIAAPWFDAGGEGHLVPSTDPNADRQAARDLERIFAEASSLAAISEATQEKLRLRAEGDFRTLWRFIEQEADAVTTDAERRLKERGQAESSALLKMLETQRTGIVKRLGQRAQLDLFADAGAEGRDAKKQAEDELAYLEGRVRTIEKDIESEPAQIAGLYELQRRRLEPVGLVYLWPETS
ncbi:MAG: DISARM system SNF2-like helicase DrmD [Sandaracinus sp.]